MINLRSIQTACVAGGFLAAGLGACKHDIPEPVVEDPGGNGTTQPCDPGTVYFQNDILPFLIANCAQADCHDQAAPQEGIGLYSYSSVMASGIVSPGSPSSSELYDVITEDNPNSVMPPPSSGIVLNSDQISMISTWISQGAQNNSCVADCDPNQFTFSAVIAPMIQTHCQGCHSGASPDGGLSLTNFSQISASALNGSLMAGLTGTQGIPLMPYNTSGLSACQIQQVQNWIDAGAPNN